MANNVALGVVIGGAVGATFGKALSDSSTKIDAFKQKAEKARGFHNLIGDTIRLREEMAKTADKSSDAFGKLLKSHESNIAKLKEHGFAVDRLDKDYARLGRTVKGLELGAAGRAKIGQGVEQTKEGLRVGAAVTAAVAAPTLVSANYQAIIRDIAIKGGVARTDKETAMSESIRKDAADTGIDRNELAQAVNALVAGGMSVEEAVAQARSVARFAVSQNADSTDTAKLVLALRQAGITDPKAMENALGKVAVAGDLGSFEAKDMAKHFATLMPQLTAFGMAGESATIALANMLQTQMKAAGSADQAANNLANLLSKITSDDSKKKFKDSGIDLEKSMQVNIAGGYDPITAFLGLVQEAAAKTDPAKAKEMAALQAQIAKAQDPAAAQKMLDGYLAMAGLSEYISDQQAKQAALAALQNQDLHRQNLKLIQEKNGQAKIEQDLADRRAASAQQWREVGQAMDEALARIGDAIRPATDAVASGLSALASAISDVAKEAPALAGGILGIGAAFAAFKIGAAAWKIGSGALDVARGGWLARGAAKIPGLSTVAGAASGKGGVAGKVADALGIAAGGNGTPVFVTNWPGGGLDLGGGQGGKKGPLSQKEKIERTARANKLTTVAEGAADAGKASGKSGIMARLGAVVGGGAGTMAAAGGMVAAAGAVGYGIGTVINAGINKAMSAASGRETSIGSWLYDKLHLEARTPERSGATPPVVPAPVVNTKFAAPQPPAMPAPKVTVPPAVVAPVHIAPAVAPGPTAPRPAPPQNVTFSPTIQVKVQGDVKDPRQLANELMPHLKRMFDQFQATTARGALYDAPSV
ncbi:MAG: phage tail tape measure protein [Rhodoferax sp.]